MDVSHCESAVHNVCVCFSLRTRSTCPGGKSVDVSHSGRVQYTVHTVHSVCVCFSLRTRSTREVHSVCVFQSKDKIYQ